MFQTQPRPCKEDPEGLYVVSTGFDPFVEFYDFENTAWMKLPLDIRCEYLRNWSGTTCTIDHLIVAKDRIYVFRGACLETLDLKTKTWDKVTDMKCSYEAAGVVFHCDKIYLCGDRSVQLFDPVNNSFTVLTHLPKKLAHPGVASLDDHIYVMGGTLDCPPQPLECTADAIRYNPLRRTWVRLPSMPTSRSCPLSAVVNGKIYVSGGFQIISAFHRTKGFVTSVEVYTPSVKQWHSVSPMFSVGRIVSSVSCRGKLYIFQISRSGRTVDIYDPTTGEFEFDEKMTNKNNTEIKAVALSTT